MRQLLYIHGAVRVKRALQGAFIVVALGLFGCASKDGELVVADQRYVHPGGYYVCDVPGQAQGFSPDVHVRQRGVTVIFKDARNPEFKIEIVGAPLHAIYQEEYWDKGVEARGVWRAEFERGHVFLLDERAVVLRNGLPARLGVLQMPYWPESASYMGTFLVEAYRASDAPPPVVRTIANLVVGETHYTAYYSVPARPFLPVGIPLRDVELTKQGLEARRDHVVATVTQAMVSWLSTCALTGFAKAQVPYQPPAR